MQRRECAEINAATLVRRVATRRESSGRTGRARFAPDRVCPPCQAQRLARSGLAVTEGLRPEGQGGEPEPVPGDAVEGLAQLWALAGRSQRPGTFLRWFPHPGLTDLFLFGSSSHETDSRDLPNGMPGSPGLR